MVEFVCMFLARITGGLILEFVFIFLVQNTWRDGNWSLCSRKPEDQIL
jgi:hypothetical protein